MTREIKFEAWHELSKTMFVWEDISINGRNNCIIHITKGVFPTDGTENAVILRQSTGQFDKNGVEIFGGDIYTMGEDNIRYKVVFEEGQFIGNQIGNRSLAGLSYWLNRIEIIGNIHQNLELLK